MKWFSFSVWLAWGGLGWISARRGHNHGHNRTGLARVAIYRNSAGEMMQRPTPAGPGPPKALLPRAPAAAGPIRWGQRVAAALVGGLSAVPTVGSCRLRSHPQDFARGSHTTS